MKHVFCFTVLLFVLSVCSLEKAQAQSNENHLTLGLDALYKRGFDATLSYEHETKYHHAWEYFASFYLQYDDDPAAGHITKKSFWSNYNTYLFGVAYKPCVVRGRNHHGNLRIGAMLGTDTDRFIGGGTIGYQHSYALRHGWELYILVKGDIVGGARDVFRVGGGIGFKIPFNLR